MYRSVLLAALVALNCGSALAQPQCAQEVIGNLFSELEAIDIDGEQRLKQSLDKLAAQEAWSKRERDEFTLKLSDNATVDAAESERNDLVARIYGRVQDGAVDCDELERLRAAVHDVEQKQWDAAVREVEQRVFH